MEQAGDLAGAEHQYLKTAEMGKGESVERLIALYRNKNAIPMLKPGCASIWQEIRRTWRRKTQLAKLTGGTG